MKKSIKYILGCLGLAIVLFPPPVYYAASIEGQVVDGGTGKPIEDAVVVAVWESRAILAVDSPGTIQLEVQEATTDDKGYFKILGWGPRLENVFCRTYRETPTIHIFSAGFIPSYSVNAVDYSNDGMTNYFRPVILSQHSGEQFSLQPYVGEIAGYRKHLAGLDGAATDVTRIKCQWTKITHLLAALGELNKQFAQAGITTGFVNLSMFEHQDNCIDQRIE